MALPLRLTNSYIRIERKTRRESMRGTLPALLLPVLLAACHGAPSGNTASLTGNAAAPAVDSNGVDPTEAKIVAFPEALRRTTFFRAIRDAGFDCQQVVKEAPRDRYRGNARWAAACDDGAQYLLTLNPGGIIQVSGLPNAK
jgi:hypothetical protein